MRDVLEYLEANSNRKIAVHLLDNLFIVCNCFGEHTNLQIVIRYNSI